MINISFSWMQLYAWIGMGVLGGIMGALAGGMLVLVGFDRWDWTMAAFWPLVLAGAALFVYFGT